LGANGDHQIKHISPLKCSDLALLHKVSGIGLATCGRLLIGLLASLTDASTIFGLPLCGAGWQPVGNLRPIAN
jgi:hypothetical protein